MINGFFNNKHSFYPAVYFIYFLHQVQIQCHEIHDTEFYFFASFNIIEKGCVIFFS